MLIMWETALAFWIMKLTCFLMGQIVLLFAKMHFKDCDSLHFVRLTLRWVEEWGGEAGASNRCAQYEIV